MVCARNRIARTTPGHAPLTETSRTVNAATDARDTDARSTAYLAAAAAGNGFYFRPVLSLCQIPDFLAAYLVAGADAVLIAGFNRAATYLALIRQL
jgi:hypothetical protein